MSTSQKLNFNHPVKELIWVSGGGTSANYTGALIGQWRIQINGYDRFGSRDISYFTKQQINDYHSGICPPDVCEECHIGIAKVAYGQY